MVVANNQDRRDTAAAKTTTGTTATHPHSTLAILSERHRVRRRTLLQHSSLLELIESPSLMDACTCQSI
jgi:hypothetical protein